MTDLWVRLVPVYSSEFLEDLVTPSGEFYFPVLQPGKYILLLFNGEQLITTKAVEFLGGRTELDLRVSE